jgi:hypothetical protein
MSDDHERYQQAASTTFILRFHMSVTGAHSVVSARHSFTKLSFFYVLLTTKRIIIPFAFCLYCSKQIVGSSAAMAATPTPSQEPAKFGMFSGVYG